MILPVRKIPALPMTNHEIIKRMDALSRRALHHIGTGILCREGFTFERVYEEFIYPEYEIRLIEDRVLEPTPDGEDVLGLYDPLSNTAYVDARFQHGEFDARRIFTLWHEVVGHGVLQGDWLRSQYRRFGLDEPIASTARETPSVRLDERLETQANIAGASFAAPEWMLRLALRRCLGLTKGRHLQFIRPGNWTLGPPGRCPSNYVHDFEDLCQQVARLIQPMFGGLSIESLGYCLQRCGYLLDLSTPVSFPAYRTAGRSNAPRRGRSACHKTSAPVSL